jgi:GDP-L-fucose synthase
VIKNSKIYIAGHEGMVGSACWRYLKSKGYSNLIGKSSSELDLRDQSSVDKFISKEKPDIIIDAAARVGGIWANNEYPYDFLMDNMLIQNNLIRFSLKNKVEKFIFLGSSCIYPKNSIQPIKEELLLKSPLEETNQWYAIAKISGVKLIESIRKQFGYNYVALMPTNLYGPGDNYDLKTSHVLPALIRKIHDAKINNEKVNLWGSGTPKREFLHVDDLAKGILMFIEKNVDHHIYNIGSGEEISIKKLAQLISDVINFKGDIYWDSSMPDGTYRKLMDSSKIRSLGFNPKTKLKEGIKQVYKLYKNEVTLRMRE